MSFEKLREAFQFGLLVLAVVVLVFRRRRGRDGSEWREPSSVRLLSLSPLAAGLALSTSIEPVRFVLYRNR